MSIAATTEMAEFAERKHCVSCGSTRLNSMWVGGFTDPFVQSNIEQDSYSGNALSKVIGGKIERVKCAACDMAFHKYILQDRWLRVLYSDWIDEDQIERFESQLDVGQNSDKGRQHLKHALRIKALLGSDSKRRDSLLDFGCGDGGFLTAANLLGFECYGIDFSSTRESRAKRGGVTLSSSLDDYGKIKKSPLQAVTLFEVLEHVAEPRQLLNDLHGLLKPGGVLLVEVPDCSGIKVPKSRDQFHRVHPLEHINHFTPQSLIDLCKSVGFKTAKRVPAHITTNVLDLLKTEASRLVDASSTSQYFYRV